MVACINEVWGGVHTGMPNQFWTGLKPVQGIHTKISLLQTDSDTTHLAMWVKTVLAIAQSWKCGGSLAGGGNESATYSLS